MKTCVVCKVSKPLSDFNKGKAKDGKHSYCRECQKSHYRSNSKHHRSNVKKRRDRYRADMLNLVLDKLSSGCYDCGETDPVVLEFDHVRGDKIDNISTMISNGRPQNIIIKEIDKCQVVCANCHKRRTAAQFGWKKSFAPVLASASNR